MGPSDPGELRGSATERWIGVPTAMHEWGDEWVVYAQATGSTHLLSATAGDVLNTLCNLRSPAGIDELQNTFDSSSAESVVPPDTESQHAADESTLRSMLDEFTRIGLATMHSS